VVVGGGMRGMRSGVGGFSVWSADVKVAPADQLSSDDAAADAAACPVAMTTILLPALHPSPPPPRPRRAVLSGVILGEHTHALRL